MRPIAADQNNLQYPLNELLGTRANVRLLRLMADGATGPITVSQAADQTGLTEAGARRALQGLATTGFVERIGTGRSQRFQLRASDSISLQLTELFRAEQNRFTTLISGIRRQLAALPEIDVAWIDELPTKSGQPLHVGFLANSRSLGYLTDEVRKRIGSIEREFDVTIELHAFSKADVPDVEWESATLLAGHTDLPRESASATPSHTRRTERSRMISKAIAELLDRNPSLLRRAERHLNALLSTDQGAATHDLREWRDILTKYSDRRIKEFVASETPRAERLRQSSPFFAVLSADERDEILDMIGGQQ